MELAQRRNRTNLRTPGVPGSLTVALYLARLTTCPDDILKPENTHRKKKSHQHFEISHGLTWNSGGVTLYDGSGAIRRGEVSVGAAVAAV